MLTTSKTSALPPENKRCIENYRARFRKEIAEEPDIFKIPQKVFGENTQVGYLIQDETLLGSAMADFYNIQRLDNSDQDLDPTPGIFVTRSGDSKTVFKYQGDPTGYARLTQETRGEKSVYTQEIGFTPDKAYEIITSPTDGHLTIGGWIINRTDPNQIYGYDFFNDNVPCEAS